jgi:hypothetical protein
MIREGSWGLPERSIIEMRSGFESWRATARGGVAQIRNSGLCVTKFPSISMKILMLKIAKAVILGLGALAIWWFIECGVMACDL